MVIYCGNSKFSLSEIVERPEIAALISDLGLVYRGKRLQLRSRFISCVTLDENPLKKVFPTKPSRTLCERLSERNHHRKNFSNVYESNYYYKDLSIDWD